MGLDLKSSEMLGVDSVFLPLSFYCLSVSTPPHQLLSKACEQLRFRQTLGTQPGLKCGKWRTESVVRRVERGE